MDFLKFGEEESAYDHIVAGQGAGIKTAPLNSGIWNFTRKLYSLLRSERYDVIHAHTHFISGYILLVAFFAGVKCRICHSHLDTLELEKEEKFLRKVYIKTQKFLIRLFSTHRIACSDPAGKALFGRKTFDVLYCGIDFTKFRMNSDKDKRKNMLAAMGLPGDGCFIGHVGRFEEQKNHRFIIKTFRELNKKNPGAYLLLIGDGSIMEEIKDLVDRENINNVVFLGGRDDVDSLMRNVFDVFFFPSLYEGLGIVLLEAQAVGLKCLISDTIPKEVVVVGENIHCMGLDEPAEVWADKLQELCNEGRASGDDAGISSRMDESPFSIFKSVDYLEKLYSGCVGK